jgi:uncharacterized RDD family membrane protein YckC
MPASQARSIGSLWRRFLAFMIDGLILYFVGRGLGAAFFDALSRIGPWGHLVGFCIALLYFAFLDSDVGNGQTVGKRLLQLRVLDAQGYTISIAKSVARYSLFAIPHFLNGLRLPETRTSWIASYLIFAVVLGIGGSTVYLLIFNRNTRQGLHDLAVGSYVVRAVGTGQVKTEPIGDMHWRVLRWLLLLLILLSISAGFVNYESEKSGHVWQRRADAILVEQLDGVQAARVENWRPFEWFSFFTRNPLASESALVITVWRTDKMGGQETFADQVAWLVLRNDPGVQKRDLLWLKVGRGYNLGIASHDNLQTFTHSPAEWRQHLFGSSPAPNTSAVHP